MRIWASIIATAGMSLLVASGRQPMGSGVRMPTHPELKAQRQLDGLMGRPFAVRATGKDELLVTEQDVSELLHLDVDLVAASPMAVGEDPGDVIANRAGTIAYVSGFQDGTIGIVDVSGDSTIDLVRLPSRNAYRLALSPSGARLYITSTEGQLFVLNTATRSVRNRLRLGGSLQGMTLDQDGRALYVSSTSGDIWSIDAATLRVTRHAHIGCIAQDVALSIDDKELYVACEKGSIDVLDARTLAAIDWIPVDAGSAFGLAVTPDNAQIWVTSPAAGYLTIFDRATRRGVGTLKVGGLPRRVAFSVRGDKAFVANEWNWVNIIE